MLKIPLKSQKSSHFGVLLHSHVSQCILLSICHCCIQESLTRVLCWPWAFWTPCYKGAAAAAAKSLQSCPTLCDPIDGSPPGSPIPGILQARILEWVAISFSNAWKWKVKVKSLSRVQLSAIPWTAAYQVPPSMGFSRQEYWSGVPLPSPIRVLPKAKTILLAGFPMLLLMVGHFGDFLDSSCAFL